MRSFQIFSSGHVQTLRVYTALNAIVACFAAARGNNVVFSLRILPTLSAGE